MCVCVCEYLLCERSRAEEVEVDSLHDMSVLAVIITISMSRTIPVLS